MTAQLSTVLRNRALRGLAGAVLVFCVHPLFGISEGRARKRVDNMLSFIPPVVASFRPDGELAGVELKRLLAPQVLRMVHAGQKVETPQVREWAERLLDSIIRHQLLLEAAVAAGYHPEKKLGRERVAEMKARIGETAYQETLEAQGTSDTEMGQRFAELGAIDAWIAAVILPKCQSTENDLRAHYGENISRYRTPELLSASHILIRADEDAPKKERSLAKREAKVILQEIRTDGTEFSDLARQYSDCPSRSHGGELGFFERGRMVKAFEEALLKLQRGEISDVVETRYGFHIIKGGNVIPSRQQSFDEVATGIAKTRAERSIEDLLRSTGDQLKLERDVRTFLGDK